MLDVWCDRCDLVNRPVTNGGRKGVVRGSDHKERSNEVYSNDGDSDGLWCVETMSQWWCRV